MQVMKTTHVRRAGVPSPGKPLIDSVLARRVPVLTFRQCAPCAIAGDGGNLVVWHIVRFFFLRRGVEGGSGAVGVGRGLVASRILKLKAQEKS